MYTHTHDIITQRNDTHNQYINMMYSTATTDEPH